MIILVERIYWKKNIYVHKFDSLDVCLIEKRIWEKLFPSQSHFRSTHQEKKNNFCEVQIHTSRPKHSLFLSEKYTSKFMFSFF